VLELKVRVDALPMKEPFTITGYVFDAMPSVVATVSDGRHAGRGEAAGVYYLNDGPAEMTAAIEAVRTRIEAGISRQELQSLLPPGGARNALDCALWELEAARAGVPVWRLAGLKAVRPLVTTMTAGADEPAAMAKAARGFADAKALKLKLTGESDLDVRRIEAVRAARPDAWLAVDANQGYGMASFREVLPAFVASGVKLVEQPLPRGQEAELEGFRSPIPIAADESIQGVADVAGLVGRFDIVNIKLDKCGGLTEALAMVEAARAAGLQVMVGNMAGTSWAAAPAFIIGQSCQVVDLDGPISMREDRTPAVEYRDGEIWCDDKVWGLGIPANAGSSGKAA
jgi:L-alanine-DL-glutamate epimerase-like enolase superfamily enzyme